MVSELAEFTLTRAIPDSVLTGVLSGSYKVFGGVVRNLGFMADEKIAA